MRGAINMNKNYSNQNMYNTDAWKTMAVSQDKSVKVEVKDVDPLRDYDWVTTNNGSCKRIFVKNTELRYNKSYNYWTTKQGNMLALEDGEWIEYHSWNVSASSMTGYQRQKERYYKQVNSNHPNFKGYTVFVHHVMAYCWVEAEGRGSYKRGVTVVDHIDEDSSNNNGDNLQYLTNEQNIAKARGGN